MKAMRRFARVTMPSAQFWLDHFRTHMGPVIKAFEAVGPEGAAALEADLLAFLVRNNISGDDTMVLAQEYLDAVITP